MNKTNCFECGSEKDIQMHHPVPRSRGGTMVIPLCSDCHNLAHHEDGNMLLGTLSKEGKERTRKKTLPPPLFLKFNPHPHNREIKMDLLERMKSLRLYKSLVTSQMPSFLHYPKIFCSSGMLFPHRDNLQFIEVNHPERSSVIATTKDNNLPWGLTGRRILVFLCSEAINRNSRRVTFKSLTSLVCRIESYLNSQNFDRYRNNILNLFNCTMFFVDRDTSAVEEINIFDSVLVSQKGGAPSPLVVEFSKDFWDNHMQKDKTLSLPYDTMLESLSSDICFDTHMFLLSYLTCSSYIQKEETLIPPRECVRRLRLYNVKNESGEIIPYHSSQVKTPWGWRQRFYKSLSKITQHDPLVASCVEYKRGAGLVFTLN